MTRKRPFFLAKTAVEFGSRTTVHGVGYVADSQFPHSIRILWLGVSVLCLCLAGYLSHKYGLALRLGIFATKLAKISEYVK